MNVAAAPRRTLVIAFLGLLGLALGCLNSRPPPVAVPKVNAAAAAAEAIKLYDANGDGLLDATELAAKCPGVLGASGNDLAKWDTNGDSKVSADEISARITSWFRNGTGLMNFACRFQLDGKPLADAQITFEPEPFLGGVIKPGSGKTEATGNVVLSIKPEDLPPADRDLRGVVHPGLYKVRVTHGTLNIPARYNTESTLGQEITPNNIETQQVVFELSSK